MVGLGVVPPKAVVARKTALKQVGLVTDDPFPFPWLFVMLEMGALKLMRVDVVMVAGRCVMMKMRENKNVYRELQTVSK